MGSTANSPALTVTGVVLGSALVAVGAWHRAIGGAVGTVLAPFAGPAGGGSLALVAFVVVTLVPPALAFAVAGVVADRRAAVRWPAAAVAMATAPLEATQLVLSNPSLGDLLRFLLAAWAILAGVVGVAAFVGGRRLARNQGWARHDPGQEDEDPPTRRA
jgi:hypothetical protein